MGFGKRLRAWGMACAMLLATALPARAVNVRIATMNLCNLSKGGTASLGAFSNIVKRVQPDVLALQEVSSSQEATLTALFATMPKPLPYRAFMQNPGTGRTTASGDKVAIFSVWPIADAAIVKENYHDPDAVEFMRWPIHAKIEVPGALNPLHVVTLHSVATTVSIPLRIHRGLEARRVREYVEERILGADENDVEYVVLGDFNDSAPGRWDAQNEGATFQPESFTYAQFRKYETNGNFGAGANFILGRDHPWYVTNDSRASFTMDYRPYPTERYGDVRPVAAFQTGTSSNWVTEWGSVYRLDYILFSPEIMASSYGAPVAEVYHSANDSAASPGLRKPGPLPDAASSTNASDHLLVFSDFHMIDEVSGLTPVAILSEVVHNPTNASANYVEICNTGNGPLDLTGYSLELYPDGSSIATEPRSLDGITLAAGATCWLACDAAEARRVWGATPNAEWNGIGYADGNDAIVLRNAAGAVHDIYGAIGVDGTGKPWEYTASAASRVPGITEPMTAWHAAEWNVAAATAATPGTHLAVSEANAAITDVSLRAADGDSTAPLASNDFRFAATAIPNVLASNLTMTAHFRVDGGDWLAAAMTNTSGTAWLSAATNGAQSAGSSIDYYVSLAFAGPGGWSPVSSAVHGYTFPGTAAATNLTDVLINEVKTSGATNEFVELVGAAGIDLSGWSLELRNKSASLVWRCTFPAGCAIPDDSVTDEFGNPLGFFVAGGSATKNRDFAITNSPESASGGLISDNAPRMLILKNAAGAVVDAVAMASTNEFVEMKLPTGISTDVARGAANYLHCLGAAPTAAAFSLQCPNNVRTGCTVPGLYALPDWSSTNATPGALNKHQTNLFLRLARVDTDADGLLDDEDNCPTTSNTVQSDIDDDGYGDECDDDMDGDGIPDDIDNCKAEYNPRQEDYNADGHGNACDPEYNDEDWEGRTETFFIDFENVSKTRWTNSVTFTASGRQWILSPETFMGKTDKDKRIGTQAMRTRTNATLTLVGPLTNGLDILSFFYGRYGTEKGTPDILVETSTDGGLTWERCCRVTTSNSTDLTPFVVANLGIPGGAHFRLRTDGETSGKQLDIDNILLVSKLAAEVTCELAAEVTIEQNGAVHTNEFYVTPSNATWTVSYTADGGATFTTTPTEIGVYTAIVTVQPSPGWDAASFEFPASLTITKPHRDPVIVTEEIIPTAVSAYLYGYVTPNSDEPLSAVFEWGTTAAFGNKHVAEESSVSGTNQVGVGYVAENLVPDTLYYWRLRVGDTVGTTRNFTTASLDRPTNTATAVSATSARLDWTPIEGATNYILTVYTSDGGASAEDLAIDFQDWTNAPSSSGNWWDLFTSPSVTTQTTASGDWVGYYATPDRTASANGIGSAGTLALETRGSWLRFPPLDGVASVTVLARSSRSTSTLRLQASTDGGTTFADAKTFSPSTTTSSNTCTFATAQPDGTVFRLYLDANRTLYLHDIIVTFAGGTQTLLDGMPANLAAPTCLLTNLTASTTYHATVKAQGPGWETEESAVLDFVIPPVPENLAATNITSTGFDLAWTALPGAEAYDVEVSTDPAFLPPFPFSDIVFDAPACSVTGLVPGTTYYVRVAESVLTNSVWSDILTVTTAPAQTPEQTFAQWLADRFGATSNAPAFRPDADADSDGMTTWEEFLADTCPTDSASRLKLELKSPLTSTQAVFRFLPSTSRWYQLVYWTNLVASNTVLDLGRPSTTNEYLIETNLPPTWFGTIRATPEAPTNAPGN